MEITIKFGDNEKKIDKETLKKYVKPVFWYGTWRALNNSLNAVCRPGRNIGYLMNAVLSGELAAVVTHFVFKAKDTQETEEPTVILYNAEEEPKEEGDAKSWKEVVIEKGDSDFEDC